MRMIETVPGPVMLGRYRDAWRHVEAVNRIHVLAEMLGESKHDADLGLVLLKSEAHKYPQSFHVLLDRMNEAIHFYAGVRDLRRSMGRPPLFRHLWLHAAAKVLEGTRRENLFGFYLLEHGVEMLDYAGFEHPKLPVPGPGRLLLLLYVPGGGGRGSPGVVAVVTGPQDSVLDSQSDLWYN